VSRMSSRPSPTLPAPARPGPTSRLPGPARAFAHIRARARAGGAPPDVSPNRVIYLSADLTVTEGRRR
jgi:hypothetical protein